MQTSDNPAEKRNKSELCSPVDCHLVVQFPKGATRFTLDWFCDTVKNSVADIKVTKHDVTGLTNLLCSFNFCSLLQSCEETHTKKLLKSEFGGQLCDFYCADSHMFDGIENPDLFFTCQETQHLSLHLLNNIRVSDNQKVQGHLFIEGQAVVPRMLATGLIKQVYPLHCENHLEDLRTTWVFNITSKQPLNAVKSYFGVHIGMYFTFLGHYTAWLCLPAFIGVFIWLFSGYRQDIDDLAFVLFGLLNVIWSTVYIELWKRRQAEQAYMWGTLDKQDDLITEPRSLYKGDLCNSPVTGRLEPHYPKWKRNFFFYAVSLPVMAVCHCFIVLVCFNFFTLYDLVNQKIKDGELFIIFKPVPNIFLALAVMVMDKVYQQIAVWLNDRENYRSEEEHRNQLIIKLMVFQSVNSFLSLFYTAFYIQDFSRLKHQLAILFVVRQVIGNMKESLLSFLIAKVKQLQGTSGSTGADLLNKIRMECSVSSIIHHPNSSECSKEKTDEASFSDIIGDNSNMPKASAAESEGLLPKYDGTFEDYLEMVIQFSYVTWFSSVFPLAGFFALLNNVVEIRSDAFKLCMSYQRPFGETVRDIGAWQTVLEIMSIGTIIVNTALIGISGPMQRMFPGMTSLQRLLLIVVLEHIVLAIKMAIRGAISGIPEWISIEMAKLEFKRRKAVRFRLRDRF